jgi:hypothetical protein
MVNTLAALIVLTILGVVLFAFIGYLERLIPSLGMFHSEQDQVDASFRGQICSQFRSQAGVASPYTD